MPTADDVSTYIEVENKEDWEEYGCDEDCSLDIHFNYDFEKLSDKAVFNLNTYVGYSRANGEQISEEYNCGYEGCFAGWYYLLGKSKNFLTDEESRQVASYDIPSLARHFGIDNEDANLLFNSLGKGVEGFPDDTFDEEGIAATACDITRNALAARAKHLDKIFEHHGISTTLTTGE